MSHDLSSLYAAVVDDLDSDEPRLVLADALQAAGDPRGELIAIQCELARLGCGHTKFAVNEMDDESPERDRISEALIDGARGRIAGLRAREKTLLDEHRGRWTEGVVRTHRFRRGFVDHAALPTIADVGATFDGAPLLSSVDLWAASPAQLAEPRLAELRHLGVGLDVTSEHAFFDGVASKLARLRSLGVLGDRPVLSKVRAMRGVAALEELFIFGNHLAGLADVLAAAKISTLRIARGERERSRTAALELANCPAARTIETLVLDGCEMRHEIADIVRSKHLQNLKVFRANEDGYDWLGVTLPAIAGSLPRLRVLDLSSNNLEGRLPLLLTGSFPELRVLRLGYTRIDDADIERLAAAPIFEHLRVLDLRVIFASNERIADALLASKHHPPLEHLVLPRPVVPALAQRLRAKFPDLDVETA